MSEQEPAQEAPIYTFYHEVECPYCLSLGFRNTRKFIPAKKRASDMPEEQRESLIKAAKDNFPRVWPVHVSEAEVARTLARAVCPNATEHDRQLHQMQFVQPIVSGG